MTLFQIISVIILALIVYAALLVRFENSIIFHPSAYPSGDWEPSRYGLSAEDIHFNAEDGVKLHGWFFASNHAKATLLWFHGNAGNISHRLDNIQRLQSLNVNIFIFDYRGYGKSEGEPDEKGIYLDSQSAYDYLTRTRKINPQQLILFGRSLGGVCALETARNNPSAALIVESSFTSAKDMAKKIFPFFPVGWALKSKLDAERNAAEIDLPKLFLHGDRDEIVPYKLGKKLYSSARAPKEFYSIKGAGHNDTYIVGGGEYFDRLNRFISEKVPAVKKD